MIYHSYEKEWKTINVICLHAIFMIKNYVVHIRASKQVLNHGLISKKGHKIIQLNQKTWSKGYLDMNNKLRTEAKNNFQNDLS